MEIIPAIDIQNGKCVRLYKGKKDQVTEYTLSPVNQARVWEEKGAARIHIVNLDGAFSGDINQNLPIIADICASTSIQTELGGGIRTAADVDRAFSSGIDYLILGTVIVKDPDVFEYAVEKYPGRIIAGIDSKGVTAVVAGWVENQGNNIFDLISYVTGNGVERIIFTDIDRDGTKTGPNLELTRQVCRSSSAEIIAAGGISSYTDLENLQLLTSLGLHGAILGKSLYDNLIDLEEAIVRFGH